MQVKGRTGWPLKESGYGFDSC